MKEHNYYVYITTNPDKIVLYIGVTNSLTNRMRQHRDNKGKPKTFADFIVTTWSIMSISNTLTEQLQERNN